MLIDRFFFRSIKLFDFPTNFKYFKQHLLPKKQTWRTRSNLNVSFYARRPLKCHSSCWLWN